jgi:glucose-6-phosphate isomerase
VGATDQHSLLQFLMEGPDDKFVLFIAVGTPRADVEIPAAFPAIGDVAYLGGHRMGELFDAERRATAAALARAGRTSATLHLPALTPFAMGETLMLFEAAVSIAGALYGVNPYGQPGVELGKRYTGALLARAGSDDAARELSARPAPSARYVL